MNALDRAREDYLYAASEHSRAKASLIDAQARVNQTLRDLRAAEDAYRDERGAH